MAVLEQITQMKGQGLQTPQIIQNLKEQGVSPKEINEALSQSEIKSEVSESQQPSNPGMQNPNPTAMPGTDISQNAATGAIPTQDPSMPRVGQNQQAMPEANPNTIGTQQPTQPGTQNPTIQEISQTDPSINAFPTGELSTQASQQPGMQNPNAMQGAPPTNPSTGIGQINTGTEPQGMQNPYPQQQTTKDTSEMQPSIGGSTSSPMQGNFQPTTSEEEYPEYSSNQYYSDYREQYPEYESPQATDIETINDISEQVAEEKVKQLKKDANLLTKFRKDSEEKIKDFERRLEKIEDTIEQLQLALIKKINDYGENINTLSKEMQNTRQTVSKMIDPLTDNIRELQKMTGKELPEPKGKKENKKDTEDKKESKSRKKPGSKKSSASFEDYLR